MGWIGLLLETVVLWNQVLTAEVSVQDSPRAPVGVPVVGVGVEGEICWHSTAHPEAPAPPTDTELQLRRDAIFCQALVAAVCTFSEQLLAALDYRYNNNGEYEESSRDASRKWLEQVAATGVLLHWQSLLAPATVVRDWGRAWEGRCCL